MSLKRIMQIRLATLALVALGSVAGLSLVTDLGSPLGLSSSPAAAAVTTSGVAIEDTFIDSGRAGTNFGQAATLEADARPATKRILVRFSLGPFPDGMLPASARLRLYVVDGAVEGGDVHAVAGSWSEAATSWSNAPAVGAKLASLTKPATSGQWVEADVTSAVRSAGLVDFYVVTTRSDGVDYRSAEGGSQAPTLLLEWPDGTAPTATPTSTSVATSTPSGTSTPPPAVTGTTYYLDARSGSDSNGGTSESQAWKSLSKANGAALEPGDQLLLKRGASWTGTLDLRRSGESGQPILVGAYGNGAPPLIQNGGPCIAIRGSYISVQDLAVDNCGWSGIEIEGDENVVERALVTRNVAGVYIKSGATNNRLLNNTLTDNNRLSDSTSGAFGVLLHGDGNQIAYNTISGSHASSPAYGTDGAAIEVYGGRDNSVHHNRAIENKDFVELGNSRSRNNTFAYNAVMSTLPDANFLVTRGAESGYGPVEGTVAEHNTVLLTGPGSQGFVCHAGCEASMLRLRDNIIEAVWKVGYADGPVDEDYGLYHGGILQFERGPNTVVADPLFADGGAGDLRVIGESPAVDSGASAPIIGRDLHGNAVPMDGDGDGNAVIDRGAYEFDRGGTKPAPTTTPAATPSATSTPSATATPPHGPAATLSFIATDDALVDEARATRNFGGAAALEVDDSPNKDFVLKFAVSGVSGRNISSAYLRLNAVDGSRHGGDVYRTSGASWTQGSVTWNSAPGTVGAALASIGAVTAGRTYQVDVTPAVTGDGIVSLRVVSSSSDGADYSSIEGAVRPELVITVGGDTGSTPTPVPTVTATSTPAPTATPSATPMPGSGKVTAVVESAPVGSSGDAADDPAIWMHPGDSSLSLVIGTERTDSGGLHVYDLNGNELQFLDIGQVNNVDVRYGFPLSSGPVDLVTATHSDDDNIVVYRVDPTTRTLVDIRAGSVPRISGAYGYCMYHSTSGKFYGFAGTGGTGTWRQVEFTESGTPGRVTYSVVRTIDHPLDDASDGGSEKMEGCVADDRTADLYISEEEYGIHRYNAEPDGGDAYTTVATIDAGSLSADIEGLALYPAGANGGYLIASSQGADDYSVFELPSMRSIGRFEVEDGAVDGTTHTDGITAMAGYFDPRFQRGLFVAQDDHNSGGGNQNFKFVSWESIAARMGLP